MCFGEADLQSGVNRHGVVVVYTEALNEAEGLHIGKDVVSPGAWACGFGVAGGLVVGLSPIRGVSADVEPGAADKLVV